MLSNFKRTKTHVNKVKKKIRNIIDNILDQTSASNAEYQEALNKYTDKFNDGMSKLEEQDYEEQLKEQGHEVQDDDNDKQDGRNTLNEDKTDALLNIMEEKPNVDVFSHIRPITLASLDDFDEIEKSRMEDIINKATGFTSTTQIYDRSIQGIIQEITDQEGYVKNLSKINNSKNMNICTSPA